jgi:uncharacterized small protein (DUF1192 family)
MNRYQNISNLLGILPEEDRDQFSASISRTVGNLNTAIDYLSCIESDKDIAEIREKLTLLRDEIKQIDSQIAKQEELDAKKIWAWEDNWLRTKSPGETLYGRSMYD